MQLNIRNHIDDYLSKQVFRDICEIHKILLIKD